MPTIGPHGMSKLYCRASGNLDISTLEKEFGGPIGDHPDIAAAEGATAAPDETEIGEGAIVPVE